MAGEQKGTLAPTSAVRMTREEIASFFDRREAAYDDLDAATLTADYADDAVVESPFGGTHHGREAIAAVFSAFFEGFPDVKMRTEHILIDGDQVAQLFKAEGTDLGRFLGLEPTGKSFHLIAMFWYELKNRKIVRERRIYDFTGLLLQIGVLKAKPI